MIKILPINECGVKPYFYIQSDISINDGESYCDHKMILSDDEKQLNGCGYMSFADAERLVKKWKSWNDKADKKAENDYDFTINLNEIWELHYYLKDKDSKKHFDGYCIYDVLKNSYGFSEEDIEDISNTYCEFRSMFDECVEHAWNMLTYISIKYMDENGKIHECEVS